MAGSMYGVASFIDSEEHGAAWTAPPYAVASGESAVEHVRGRSAWASMDEAADLNAIFSLGIRSLGSNAAPEVAAALLDGNPGVRGILYDARRRWPRRAAPDFGKLLDLEVLVMTPGGRERTRLDSRRCALVPASGSAG